MLHHAGPSWDLMVVMPHCCPLLDPMLPECDQSKVLELLASELHTSLLQAALRYSLGLQALKIFVLSLQLLVLTNHLLFLLDYLRKKLSLAHL